MDPLSPGETRNDIRQTQKKKENRKCEYGKKTSRHEKKI